MEKIEQEESRPPRIGWLVVFALNLCVPLFFGWEITRDGGRYGMISAIALLWLIGHYLCGKSQTWAFLLPVGGGIVAATQFVPILQIISGMIGVTLAGPLELDLDLDRQTPEISTVLGGFLATVVTGCLLTMAAVVFGWMAHGFLGWIRPHPQSASPGIYDRELDG